MAKLAQRLCNVCLTLRSSCRFATPTQFAALVARDNGCVLCGADPSRCQAHHLKPFEAEVKGKTNIDELALLCTSCHTWVHDAKQTLYYLVHEQIGDDPARGSPPTLVWRTRPATPKETAPTQQPKSRKHETKLRASTRRKSPLT